MVSRNYQAAGVMLAFIVFYVLLISTTMNRTSPDSSSSMLTGVSQDEIEHNTRAYVMSVNVRRGTHTSNVLKSLGFDVSYAKIMTDRNQVLSNKRTHYALVNLVANDDKLADDDWSFIFEDDINTYPNMSIQFYRSFSKAKQFEANHAGFIYLGICLALSDHYASKLWPPEILFSVDGVESRRCVGACTHAYGMTKWRAKGLFTTLLAAADSAVLNKTNYADLQLSEGFKAMPSEMQPLCLGWSLKHPIRGEHRGFLYQDRELFASTI